MLTFNDFHYLKAVNNYYSYFDDKNLSHLEPMMKKLANKCHLDCNYYPCQFTKAIEVSSREFRATLAKNNFVSFVRFSFEYFAFG